MSLIPTTLSRVSNQTPKNRYEHEATSGISGAKNARSRRELDKCMQIPEGRPKMFFEENVASNSAKI